MMHKQKTKCATFYFVAAVFLACYLANTVDCSRRWKPVRIDVQKEADLTDPVDVYEGEILFGKSLKGPESQLMNDTNHPSSNTSEEDEAKYQADVPVFPYDQAHMDGWHQMTKSLQCGADQMHFNVVGSGFQHFTVDQLNGPSLPFPLVPPSCGYNIRRLPSSLHLSVPYSGCHMIREGGHYMLPLTWQGIPVVLSCQTPNWIPWHHSHPIPPFPPVLPPYPWHPPAGEMTCPPTAAPQGPIPCPMDPWPIGQQPDVNPGDPCNVKPAELPFAPPPMPQMPFPYPFPWYHCPPYNFYHTHPPYHPYWLHGQMPTQDTN